MKNQNNNLVFALVSLFLVMLLAVGVIAQSAGSNTWVSPSSGITVTVTSPAGSIVKDKVVYKFEGTGKNDAPKGTGKTDPAPVPTSCPRDPKTEALYSETKNIKDKDGKTIAKIKIVRNVDCTTHSMTILDEKWNNPITLTRR
mgnify:FL=1